jgi:hypothetical protein
MLREKQARRRLNTAGATPESHGPKPETPVPARPHP